MTLTQITEGAVAWAGTMNANIAFLRLPPGYVSGLGLSWISGTQINVNYGSARDDQDMTDIVMAPGTTTTSTAVSISSSGSINELDAKSAGTGTTNATTTISSISSSLIPVIGQRTTVTGTSVPLPGTITSSGASITGSGTAFTRDVAVGDLIGTRTTYGFANVTAIGSDTTLTISASLPGGNITTGVGYSILENATIQPGSSSNDLRRISTLTAAGTTAVVEG